MQLVLFRHGIAFDRLDPNCPPDAERPLTERGIERTAAAVAGLAALGVSPDVVVTSPLLRARQTAGLVLDGLGPARQIETPSLEPMCNPGAVLELVQGIDAACVLCAGHAPHLDELLEQLTGTALPRLKKAGGAAVELDAETGLHLLAWYASPRTLRRLGRQ